jgi:hypothetical protein
MKQGAIKGLWRGLDRVLHEIRLAECLYRGANSPHNAVVTEVAE